MNPLVVGLINRLVPCMPKSIPEGSSPDVLRQFCTRLLEENCGIDAVAETGFNTGGSSRTFLGVRPDVTVVSFDIGQKVSMRRAKAAIDRRFPGRHELVLGDSTETLPAYARAHPDKRFDLVFIDGGHAYEVARADLLNFRAMSHGRTIVIMDDLTPWWVWGQGPTRAWQEAVRAGLIVQDRFYRNGELVREPTGAAGDCIWGVGCYRARTGAGGEAA